MTHTILLMIRIADIQITDLIVSESWTELRLRYVCNCDSHLSSPLQMGTIISKFECTRNPGPSVHTQILDTSMDHVPKNYGVLYFPPPQMLDSKLSPMFLLRVQVQSQSSTSKLQAELRLCMLV